MWTAHGQVPDKKGEPVAVHEFDPWANADSWIESMREKSAMIGGAVVSNLVETGDNSVNTQIVDSDQVISEQEQ